MTIPRLTWDAWARLRGNSLSRQRYDILELLPDSRTVTDSMSLPQPVVRTLGHTIRAVLAVLLLATAAHGQERPGGIPITFDVAGIYTDAFGGRGGGFQITVSTPIPISFLGAHYTAGGQFWYSQTRTVGGSIDDSWRQLTGFGGHLTAAWSISNRVFPYLRLPVQALRSQITGNTTNGPVAMIPIENQVGTTSSLAFGIAGGAIVQLGRAMSMYCGFTSLSQRLYEVNHTPIWSLELGVGVAPGAFRRR